MRVNRTASHWARGVNRPGRSTREHELELGVMLDAVKE